MSLHYWAYVSVATIKKTIGFTNYSLKKINMTPKNADTSIKNNRLLQNNMGKMF
jgi:hypothetical protein